jgi:hypothetical protein
MSDPMSPPAPGAQSLMDESAPAVVAMRMIHKIITEVRGDPRFTSYADMDLRVLRDVTETLTHKSNDPSAVQWLRQLALSWQTKLRNAYPLKFRRILEILDGIKK